MMFFRFIITLYSSVKYSSLSTEYICTKLSNSFFNGLYPNYLSVVMLTFVAIWTFIKLPKLITLFYQ